MQEPGERRPAIEHVVHRLCDVVVARELGAFLPHPALEFFGQRHAEPLTDGKTIGCRAAVDVALDIEQSVDAADRRQRHGRDKSRRLALRLALRIRSEIGEDKEFPSRVTPARGLRDRTRQPVGFVQLAIATIGISLEDSGIVGQVSPGMCSAAIARIVKHRGRRRRSAERAVITHIDPRAGDVGLAAGQHRHGGIIAMQPRGGEDMRLDTLKDRRQHRAAGANLVGQRRQAERHAFLGVAFSLPIKRLVLSELFEHQNRQQAGTGPTAGDHMERRGRLADALAVAAGELLADVLDHLPLPRNDLERLGDILAQLGQTRPAAAGAGRRAGHHHPLARQMLGERLARAALAAERGDIGGLGRRLLGREFILRRRRFQFFELQFHLIEQPRAALRALAVNLPPELLDLQLQMHDQR